MHKAINSILRAGVVVSGLALAGGAFAAAGLTPVTFQLNWVAGGPNAGFAAAVRSEEHNV